MKKHFLFLFILTCAYKILDQWLTSQTQMEIGNPDGARPLVWVYGFFSVVVGLFFPLLSSLIIFAMFKKESSPFVFLKKFFSQSLIEALRAWGKALSWSLLFVIPGIVKFAQYFFVPFVVCFDSAYQNGQVDALERSKQVSKGKLGILLGLLLFFDAVIPIILSSFDEYSVLWQTPPEALILCFVEMLLNICFIWILWRIYESTFSMERH